MVKTTFTYLVMLLSGYNLLFAQEALDTLLTDLETEQISKNQFEQVENESNTKLWIDTTGYIGFLNLSIVSNCLEICETYLHEPDSKESLLLPSNFDQGVIDLLFSPSGKQFAIYSSYDGPDYINYYNYRAEIFVYEVKTNSGLDGIKPKIKFTTNQWSIDGLVWLNENFIALKTYKDYKNIDGECEYIQVDIINNK